MDFVQDDAAGMPGQEPARVAFRHHADVRVLQGDVVMVRERLPRECRLARLARAGDDDDAELAAEGLDGFQGGAGDPLHIRHLN